MRGSERAAVAAVIFMVLPGLLAVMALPAWAVSKAWPSMGGLDRGLFAASALGFALASRPVFGRRLGLLYFGRFEELSLFEKIILLVPLTGAWFASTHDLGLPAAIGCIWMAIRVQLAIEETVDDRPPRLPARVPGSSRMPDRIEPRLSLASVVVPRIPRRWWDRAQRMAWRWQRATPNAIVYALPPDQADADP